MNKTVLFGLAASQLPRVSRIRGSTWIAIAAGLLILIVILVWSAIALTGWLFGQGKNMAGAIPDTIHSAKTVVLGQVETIAPGIKEKAADLMPALNPSVLPSRDVSGSDIGPVVRYPGLVRIKWLQESGSTSVGYSGKADYHAVLEYYAKGFSEYGFTQSILSASVKEENHRYTKSDIVFDLHVVEESKSSIAVTIETVAK